MNLNPLYELKDRLSACAVAGTKLALEDFRLKRAVEQAQPLAAANKVFAQICAMAEKVASPDCEDRGGALLDTLALLDAVLCTQGVTGVQGELAPLEVAEGARYVPKPYSQLQPLIVALTGTGGGRYNVICEALEKSPELTKDFRLRPLLVQALGDSYSETADKVMAWMQKHGDAAYITLLKKGFDPKGKKDMLRRVQVLDVLAGGAENDWYLEQLEQKCTPDIRCKLIEALRHLPENGERLAGFYKTEKGEAKKSALSALACQKDGKMNDFWLETLRKTPKLSAGLLTTRSDECFSEEVAEQLGALLDTLLAGDGLMTPGQKEDYQMWVSAAFNKRSAGMQALYRRAAQRQELLSALSDPDGSAPVMGLSGSTSGNSSPAALLGQVVANTIIWSADPKWIDLALECYRKWPGEITAKPALVAAFLSMPAAQVYEEFSPAMAQFADPQMTRSHFVRSTYKGKQTHNKYHTTGARELAALFGQLQFLSDARAYALHIRCQQVNSSIDNERLAALFGRSELLKDEKAFVPNTRRDRTDSSGERARSGEIKRLLPEPPDKRWFRLLARPGVVRGNDILAIRRMSCYNDNLSGILDGLVDPEDPELCEIAREVHTDMADVIPANDLFERLIRCGQTDFSGLLTRYIQYRGWWDYTIYFELKQYYTPQQASAELMEIARLMREGKLTNRNKHYNNPEHLEWNARQILQDGSFENMNVRL